MESYEIATFREKLSNDKDNLNVRRSFHEQYEWLEAYWQNRYGNNYISKFSDELGYHYWNLDEFKDMAREFSGYTPVGSSNRNFDPTESVKQATFHLRHHAQLFETEMPPFDYENEVEIGSKWRKHSFEAVLTLVKQVRDNLFHGRKMDLQEDK
ncbi:MAG: hypothetical protein RH860_11480 [Cytophagales bacterium]